MSSWVSRCSRMYRRVARAFPHDFRMICGDGLERLGEDIAPLVWREQGILGLMRLFGDLALHLPLEYLSTWTGTFKEFTMTGDLFEGTWKAKNELSQWDPAYTPEQACLRFEATEAGYLLVAYGIKDGQAVAERPTSIIADGSRRPLVDLNGRPIPGVPPGALAFGSRPDSDGTGTIQRITDSRIHHQRPSSFTPDGRHVLLAQGFPGLGAQQDLGMVALTGDRRLTWLIQTPLSEFSGEVSPNGRWLRRLRGKSNSAAVDRTERGSHAPSRVAKATRRSRTGPALCPE